MELYEGRMFSSQKAVGYILVTFVALSGVLVNARSTRDRIILPPLPPGPQTPDCTSYSGLCHIAYNITTHGSYHVYHSNQQVCRCSEPGQHCNTDWFSPTNALTRVFKSSGQEIEVKMSYCSIQLPDKVCRQNEMAMVTRGRGAFTFEIVSDFSCRCYRQLFAHRSWREGDYDYIEYSCGKPRCGMNQLPSTECTRLTYDGSPHNIIHDYKCRCRRHEECIGGELPSSGNPVVSRSCQRLPWTPGRRRRLAQRTRH